MLERLWAGWRAGYVQGTTDEPFDGCLFCGLGATGARDSGVLARDDLVFAVMNAYPYTSGHVMVAPVRHEATLTGLTDGEAQALMAMTRDAATALEAAYGPEGMNVGANVGRAAGAGVPGHLHVHLVPRWSGDTNFMTAIAETRVLPESLAESCERLRRAWPTR